MDECTEGAKVTAMKVGNGKVYEAVTDSYGDFWLRDVEPGEYTVLVEKEGYLPQKMGPVDADQGHQRRRHRGLEGLTPKDRGKGPAPAGGRALLFLEPVGAGPGTPGHGDPRT